MTQNITHNDLIKIAERWLLNTKKCSFVFTELVCLATSEIPDAIGFQSGQSMLIECKVSRADFLADRKKIFRRNPFMGMGTFRYFFCPAGIIQPEDLPPKWGLIWVNEKGKPRQIVGPKGNIWSSQKEFLHDDRNIQAEWGLMASALRRLHLRGVLPLIYDSPFKKDNTNAAQSAEIINESWPDDLCGHIDSTQQEPPCL